MKTKRNKNDEYTLESREQQIVMDGLRIKCNSFRSNYHIFNANHQYLYQHNIHTI